MESSSSDMLGGIVFLGVLVVCIAVGLALLAFWLWMLIHSLTNGGIAGSEKVAWVILLLFVPFIGAIMYFFVAKPKARHPLPPP